MFADKFDCEPAIRMIPAELFRFNLDVFSKKYVKICIFLNAPKTNIQLNYFLKDMLHGACQFFYFVRSCPYWENIPFKRIKLKLISYDIKITYEGNFVKVSIK